MLIQKLKVPEYLQSGSLYASLGTQKIEVPDEYIKKDCTVNSIDELKSLLKSLCYWEVTEIPLEAMIYTFETYNSIELSVTLKDSGECFTKLQAVLTLKQNNANTQIDTALQMKLGVTFVSWLYQHIHKEYCAAAAAANDLESLIFLRERGCSWDQQTRVRAICSGSMECLKYADENHCPAVYGDQRSVHHAARAGRIAMLQHLHQQGEVFDAQTLQCAAQSGTLPCVQYLHDADCPWSVEVCLEAVRANHLNMLKYAHQHGCPWDERVTTLAARFNRLDCLRYAHERGCPWNKTAANAAFAYVLSHHGAGVWSCLYYVLTHGCPCGPVQGSAFMVLAQAVYIRIAHYEWNGECRVVKLVFITMVCLEWPFMALHTLLHEMGDELAVHVSPENLKRMEVAVVLGLLLWLLCMVVFMVICIAYPNLENWSFQQ